MEHIEGEGICLRAVDFGENDKILTLYLAQKRQSCRQGARLQKPKVKTQICRDAAVLWQILFGRKRSLYVGRLRSHR